MTISPNFDNRQLPITMLMLHYTGMPTGQEALARLCDVASKVSAHYLIDMDGTVHSLVPEEKRAWHAGVGFWRGVTDINSASIGIELVNKGHEWGYHPFPEAQMAALLDLCKGIVHRHTIPAQNIIGHSDGAPSRKTDPGELFPWQWLAENGIGLWPAQPEPATQSLPALLAAYGYDISDEAAAITAFYRHFYPQGFAEPNPAYAAMLCQALLTQAERAIA